MPVVLRRWLASIRHVRACFQRFQYFSGCFSLSQPFDTTIVLLVLTPNRFDVSTAELSALRSHLGHRRSTRIPPSHLFVDMASGPWLTLVDLAIARHCPGLDRFQVANLLQQWKGGARGPPSKSEEAGLRLGPLATTCNPPPQATLLADMLRVDPVRRSTSDEASIRASDSL